MDNLGFTSVINAILEDSFGFIFQLISQILTFLGQFLSLAA